MSRESPGPDGDRQGACGTPRDAGSGTASGVLAPLPVRITAMTTAGSPLLPVTPPRGARPTTAPAAKLPTGPATPHTSSRTRMREQIAVPSGVPVTGAAKVRAAGSRG